MTKEKIKYVIKRTPYILDMLKRGKTVQSVYIGRKKEKIVIDDEVLVIFGIEDEIIENEKSEWMRKIFAGIRNGVKDITIIADSPMERTKFYEIKKDFVNRIYACCVFKGFIPYEDILRGVAL